MDWKKGNKVWLNVKDEKKDALLTDGVLWSKQLLNYGTTKRAYAYKPQSNADGSSIMEKSHISMPISIVTGMLSPSTALALVISIIAGPYGQNGVVRIIFKWATPLSMEISRPNP